MSFTIKRSQPKSLCNTCDNCIQIKGMRMGEDKTFCQALPSSQARITFPVEDCTSYHERHKVDIHEMRKIAWVIEQKKGQFVGFHDPEAARKKGVKIGDTFDPY